MKTYPLTESQKGIYLECIAAPQSLKYNIPVLYNLPKNTDEEKFISALKTVIKSHKVMNINICTPNGIPSMVYVEKEPKILSKSITDKESEIKNFIKPFDLEKDTLYRFEFLKINGECALLMDIHHIISDGTSVRLLISQTMEVYDGHTVSEEEMSIFDVSEEENKTVNEEKRLEDRTFFEEMLGDADCDSRPIPDVIKENGLTGSQRFEANLSDKINICDVEKFVKANNISENAFFLGAFAYTLAKLNGSKDCLFSTIHNGRSDHRLSSSFGMFVKTLPMYCKIDDNMKTAEFLTNVYNEYYNVRRHDRISFRELAEKYGVNMGITFIYHGKTLDSVPYKNSKIAIDIIDPDEIVTDIDVMIKKFEKNYELFVDYKKELYSDEFAENIEKMYINVISSMLKADSLADVIFTDDESKKQLDMLNKTECNYDSSKTVIDLFREQVKKTPDNICLVYCDKRYTYREVDNITDIIAKNLVKMGVCKEKIVGVLIPRCEYMLLCSLGVLKAGGAYMPLDPTYPPERLNLMMQDSNAMMLIYAPELNSVIDSEYKGIRISTEQIKDFKDCDVTLVAPETKDLFVMLYTSGSTGIPKGVMFEHSNTVVTVEWVKKYYEMNENSCVTLYASYGFDAHAYDMYSAITSGAQLHIISEEIRLDFIALKNYFNENKITHTVMTTQVGRQFALMGGLKTLRHLTVAGEKLAPVDVPEVFNMYNVYGPTEGSIVSTAFKIDCKYKDIPIGKPVDNLKVHITDKNGRLLPIGATGELWISGPHVTRGYLNRPEKNAEAYGDNPFCSDKGYERVYKTGDIVRLLNDGNIQFIGRRDAQVKVRGFRVELTEIEEVIRRYPGINDATVAAFDEQSGGKFVAAYIVSDEKISYEEIADFIRSEKPPYMVPAVIMQIDKIPLNQNQKVNKRALPVPKREVADTTPPENDTQKKIFDIIADVIGHSDFGINTDIYDAGLTSIGAVKLNVSLAECFDVPIKIADIKSNNNVKKLEKFIISAKPCENYEILDDYPITEAQSGIFVECMSSPDTTIYNMPILIKLGKNINPEKLANSVKAAIDAHSYIKTTLFTDKTGNIRAKRNDSLKAEVSLIKCKNIPDENSLVKPFELINSPLYRASVYETEDGNYLFMDFHHIIGDGTSETIIFNDINKAFSGEILNAETFSGFELALEEQKIKGSSAYEKAKEYWKKLLWGCETSCLPKKEPENSNGGVGRITEFGTTDANAVKKFCLDNGITLNSYFNSVFAFVMSRFSGKDNLTYATVYNGRSDSRTSNTVSLLVKTMPVTADFTNDTKITDYMLSMQNQLIDSMSNDMCSFAELSHTYDIKADIILVYQGDDFVFDSLCGEKAEIIELSLNAAKAPISVNIYSEKDSFKYIIEYRKEMFNKSFALCLLDSLAQAANAFAECKKISDVSLMTEKAEAVYDILNESDYEIENTNIVEVIEKVAKENADSTAVICDGETLTYKELDTFSNILANKLKELGVKNDDIIGLVLERNKSICITEFGILKSGGAFLPMIPSYPDERIEFCLTNAKSPYVITTEAIKAEKPELFADEKPYKTLTIEQVLSGKNDKAPNVKIMPENLAYCIYTSGSTGTPKGVMIEHHNFIGFLRTQHLPHKYFKKSDTGSVIAVSSISFDMSLFEIWPPLFNGKSVYIATEEEFHNPQMMIDLMIKNDVGMLTCTPSFLNNMTGFPEFADAVKKLTTIVCGAESFPAPLYEKLRSITPDLQIVNGYGPTEATICCSTKELHSGEGITIGRPTKNAKFFVTDKFGNVLPPYAIGELIICGDCVGRGYVQLPEKTAASFFKLRGLPAYHSGDVVRLTGNAEIDFGGRIDNQVKLRGFRVELDEIEKVMLSFDSILQSKVIVRNNGTEDYLAGFFTASSKVDTEALGAHLKSRLTYYMVPSVLVQIDKMPLTPNGKIDKKAFPEVKQNQTRKAGKKAPKKSLEQRLCEIFASVLGIKEIFADDNFFELGGTSLTASKVTMLLMSENIEVKYGDIFDHPTPETLAEFIEQRDSAKKVQILTEEISDERTHPALKWNMVKYAHEVKRESIGNVLLTGAAGFLGIHILKELLEIEDGHIWCLIRKGSHDSSEIRLKTMLIYYFSNGFDEELKNRITVIDADITDSSLYEKLSDIPFDTVINCAACVKHFSDSNILEQINVEGVKNLISVCTKKNAKFVQISTVSVPGMHTDESYEKQVRMHENELFMIDDMDNKYIISKHKAERFILDSIENGLRGKIIRVGNLMGRHSDGEFQANLETNMFLSGIRGFAFMGKYPISHMTDPMSFSPVDCTARAVVLLAGTNDKFTAFNADNRYGFDEMKIIDACNRNGIAIYPEKDEIYYEEFNKKLGDDHVNSKLNGLAAYDIKDAHIVETDNLFTTNILYRIGFSWPLVDDTYLDKAIHSIMTLDYFNTEGLEDN